MPYQALCVGLRSWNKATGRKHPYYRRFPWGSRFPARGKTQIAGVYAPSSRSMLNSWSTAWRPIPWEGHHSNSEHNRRSNFQKSFSLKYQCLKRPWWRYPEKEKKNTFPSSFLKSTKSHIKLGSHFFLPFLYKSTIRFIDFFSFW